MIQHKLIPSVAPGCLWSDDTQKSLNETDNPFETKRLSVFLRGLENLRQTTFGVTNRGECLQRRTGSIFAICSHTAHDDNCNTLKTNKSQNNTLISYTVDHPTTLNYTRIASS
ncbi:hypothetical protein O181_044057 [Austropuccinia psidii MF-1]|uniref:Uncharacterized protein n=1 Tax=Austropuccinia psidii MF-1 TaxID=1389203 RepID=A0A9Q3HHE6_9BASI|nr:hypothetical protein [Austropuccinia psidii MF-1]